MSLGDCLSSAHISQLNNITLRLISSEGDFLEPCDDESLTLGVPNADGSIPDNDLSVLSGIYNGDFQSTLLEGIQKEYINSYLLKMETKKMSAGLLEFLWSSDKGEAQVEIRSPVPGFPPRGQLRVVIKNMSGFGRRNRKTGDEYCLAAGEDGTVKWLPESDCVGRNHIWTVHLFERRVGQVLYLRDQLRRTEPNVVYNNCEINFIGGNVNGSGTQTIGNVTATTTIKNVTTTKTIGKVATIDCGHHSSRFTTNCNHRSSRFTKVYQLMQRVIS